MFDCVSVCICVFVCVRVGVYVFGGRCSLCLLSLSFTFTFFFLLCFNFCSIIDTWSDAQTLLQTILPPRLFVPVLVSFARSFRDSLTRLATFGPYQEDCPQANCEKPRPSSWWPSRPLAEKRWLRTQGKGEGLTPGRWLKTHTLRWNCWSFLCQCDKSVKPFAAPTSLTFNFIFCYFFALPCVWALQINK